MRYTNRILHGKMGIFTVMGYGASYFQDDKDDAQRPTRDVQFVYFLDQLFVIIIAKSFFFGTLLVYCFVSNPFMYIVLK